MIFAIAGSQGSGKTTILNALKERGYKVVERKTARSVLTDWGLTLDEVNADIQLKMKFQEELLHRKITDDLQEANSVDICFTERSFADLFTYALINIGQYNECNEFINNYYQTCSDAMNHYEGIFYIQAGHFAVAEDGVRSINKYYSQAYDISLKRFTLDMAITTPIIEISDPEVEKRTTMVEDMATKIARTILGVYQ